MQHKYLVLVALTPQELLNPLRNALQRLSLDSLRAVKYDSFRAIILGDFDKEEGPLKFVKAPNGTKGLRLKFALEYLTQNQIDYDYIARFDDDDVLNPCFNENLALRDVDCYADLKHAFFDLNSGLAIQSKKDWMANTVFFKKEHALHIMQDGRTLIEQDHAEEWQSFFKDKNVSYSKNRKPLYLRVLSPTSITAKVNAGNTYGKYLSSFGNWGTPIQLNDFKESIEGLELIHQKFFPEGKEPLPSNGIKNKFIQLFKK